MASNTPGNTPFTHTSSGADSQGMRNHVEAQPAMSDFWRRLQYSDPSPETQAVSRQGIDQSRIHEALPIAPLSADQLLRTSQMGEAFKRRRTGYDPSHPTSGHGPSSDDLVKSLFHLEAVKTASNRNLYSGHVATPASTASMNHHSNSLHRSQQMSGHHSGSQMDTPSPFLSKTFRSSANGLVPQTPSRSSRINIRDLSATESPGVPGGVSLGSQDTTMPYNPQMGSFELPGLGAGAVQTHPKSFSNTAYQGNSGFNPAAQPNAMALGRQSSVSNVSNNECHIPGLFLRPNPPAFQIPAGLISEMQQKTMGDGPTAMKQHNDLHLGSPDKYSNASLGTPSTEQKGSTESRSHRSHQESAPSSTVCVPESSVPQAAPAVWQQAHHAGTFRMQNVARSNLSEAFEGAFNVLGTMNPDHYQMPLGTRVVCIKCQYQENALKSIQTGLFACNPNVMQRIVSLGDSRKDKSEKILLLWSVPGSKNFCGLAEMQDFLPEHYTDFWHVEGPFTGAMRLRWLYCKLVPFDKVRKLEKTEKNDGPDTVTQMWSGMHYTEEVGREVVKAYVEAPHLSNLLAKPPGGHFRQPLRRNNPAAASRNRGNSRANQHPGPASRNGQNGQNGQNESRTSHTNAVASSETARQPSRDLQAHKSVQEGAMVPVHASQGNEQVVAQPTLQMMPVYVHPDGRITPALSVGGSFSSLGQVQSLASLQSLNTGALAGTPLTQFSSTEGSQVGGQFKPNREMPPPGHPFTPMDTNAVFNLRALKSSPEVNKLMQNRGNINSSRPFQGNNGSSRDGHFESHDNFEYQHQPHTPARRAYRSSNNMSGYTGSPSNASPTPRAFSSSRIFYDHQQALHAFSTPVRGGLAAMLHTPTYEGDGNTPHPLHGDASAGAEALRSDIGSMSSGDSYTNHWIDELVRSPKNE